MALARRRERLAHQFALMVTSDEDRRRRRQGHTTGHALARSRALSTVGAEIRQHDGGFRSGGAACRVLGQQSHHKLFERRRNIGRRKRWQTRSIDGDGVHRRCRRRRRERMATSGQLIQHHTEGEHVGLGADPFAAGLLRRHVAHSAEHVARGGGECRHAAFLALVQLCDAEVEQFHQAVVANHDVFGLDVAMDDSCGVGHGQRLGDLPRPLDHDAAVNRLTTECSQRPASDELHRNELASLGLADVVNGDDVRVIERRGDSGFLFEAADTVRLLREVARQQLDGRLSLQARVLHEVHHSHATGTKGLDDTVMTDL